MVLIRLKRAAQITLPAELRKQFQLKEGDYLDAEAVEGGILLKPVAMVERQKAWEKVLQAMATVQDRQPHPNQTPQEQEEEIARWVKESRRKNARRRS